MMRPLLVGGSLAFSIIAGFGWQGSGLPSTPLSPSNEAFGIWAIIYAALAISALALVRHDWAMANAFTACLCVSLTACGAWILLVRRYRAASVAAIAVAFVAAVAATALAPISKDSPESWAVAIGPGLLAGWLSVAVVLGILITFPAIPQVVSPLWLVPSVATALSAGAFAGNPAAAAAIGWAAVFSRSTNALTLGGAATVGGAAAALRLLGLLGRV